MDSNERFNITYDKLVAAADIYSNEKERKYRPYRTAYVGVDSNKFRDKLVHRPDMDSVEEVRAFLASWRSRTSSEVCGPLIGVLKENAADTSDLSRLVLESSYLSGLNSDKIHRVYGDICSIKGLGHTTASKILGVLNPQLFVMWDEPVRKVDGGSYLYFLLLMQKEALKVLRTPKSSVSMSTASRVGMAVSL